MSKKICDQLNFAKQCRKHSLSLWQCPLFLTPIIGVVIIITMISAYIIGNKYTDQPELVALIIIGITVVLIIIGYFIIKGFDTLAEANQMKTEFVSIASHQLRTPLSIIKWTLNLMMDNREDKLTAKSLDYLKDIENNNQRIINLVNDLLNVSRIEQGRLGLRSKSTNLITITENMITNYEHLAKASNITIVTNFDRTVGDAWTDPEQIKIVMQNLLDNAIRYASEGKNKITIAIYKLNSNFLRWEITDSGVGIPKSDRKKIFQKFFRSQNILRYQTQGTGLGLFIAKAIINESKGNIGFKSQEGQGSTFWFEIPLKNHNL